MWPGEAIQSTIRYSMSADDSYIEELVGEERADWYRLTPQEQFMGFMKLSDTYLALGGSIELETDPQSPFFDPQKWNENASDGRPSVRIVRRGVV